MKRVALILLVSYVIVLLVNLAGNYEYYKSGNDWRPSVIFTLSVTTIGLLAYILPYELLIRKRLNWSTRPNFKLLMLVLFSGLYGLLLMVLFMQAKVWLYHLQPYPLENYIDNSIYAVLLCMLVSLIMHGQAFLTQLKRSAQANEMMQRQLLQAQYEALKNQVNPHFFFNSLNTLISIIPEEPEVAVNFVKQLSRVFRYAIENSGENTVPLEKELKVAESFLFIHTQRFQEKLKVEINVDEAALRKSIVSHSLLMLVENVIKHNEISGDKPLTLRIYNDDETYLIIENTLNPKLYAEPSTGIGLSNIKERYKLLSDKSVTIETAESEFRVKIPLL
jgi:sensor histidine kinase YesM